MVMEPLIKEEKLPSSHHSLIIRLTGRPKDIFPEIAKRLANDYITPLYEHMSLRVMKIEFTHWHNVMSATLYKNLYAGD